VSIVFEIQNVDPKPAISSNKAVLISTLLTEPVVTCCRF